MDRRWKVTLFSSAVGVVTFAALGAVGAPDWVLLTTLVAFLGLLTVAGLVVNTGTEPAYTHEEATEVLGIPVDKIDLLIADAVLKPQRSPGGGVWGVTVSLVERERLYRERPTFGRRLLRFLRRVVWWMP